MTGWQDIAAEALHRIQSRRWPPGSLIPNEAMLAQEFGCARATVNRALQALAEDGWLERRRRAGTRVADIPQRRAQISIPILREEIEALGAIYSHALILNEDTLAPPAIRAAFGTGTAALRHIQTLHMRNTQPFAVEDRWVAPRRAEGIRTAPLDQISANEWLVRHAPFQSGTLDYSAEPADPFEATHLACAEGAPLMILNRQTFSDDGLITQVRIAFARGHRLRLDI